MLIVIASVAAGCAGSETSSTASTGDVTSPSTAPTTDQTIPVTDPPSTEPTTTSATTTPSVDGPCAFTPPSASITYVQDDRLVEVRPDGSGATCLATLDAPPSGPVSWSPDADQVLIGGDRVIGTDGTRTTGYFATNQDVHWSYPTGKALIAPSVKDGSLVWRSATNSGNRIDISFLADTTLAVYHPAGKDVVAAGTAADGTAGLFMASNRGANMRPIALLEHPEDRIVDAAFFPSGDRMLFVHDHGATFEVHNLLFPSLAIGDVASYDEPIGDLRISAEPNGWAAYRVGDCSGTTTVDVTQGGTQPVAVGPSTPVAGRSLRPVGWIGATDLVVESRVSGCTGPADVWVIGMDGSSRQVLSGVEHVAVRYAMRSFGELPNDLNTDAEY